MSKKDEALKLALEALAVKFSEGWHEGIKIDASDIMLLNDAAQALAEQPAQHRAWFTVGELNAWADKKLKENPQWAEQPSQQEPVKSGEGASATVTITLPAQQEPVPCCGKYKTCTQACTPRGRFLGKRDALAEQPAQQGQVAWTLLLTGENHGLVGKAGEKFVGHPEHYERVDVYTSPQRTWVGLTDEEWQSIADTLGCFITRGQKDAIEAALGIKENT